MCAATRLMNHWMIIPSALILLLVTWCAHPANAQVSRGAGVPPGSLPKELKGMHIRDNFVPSGEGKVGVIHALEGTLVVIHKITKEAYFAREGDAVYEHDSLNTLADSRCRVRMLDEDLVTMGPDAEFSVESFQDQRGVGKKSSVFGMLRGKAMFYAMRLFRYRDTRFTLTTPTVTVGVRGTKFGAHVYWIGDEKAANALHVADSGNEIGPYLGQAQGTGKSFTDCHSEDGVLDVDGKTVLPGQMYKGDTGQVIPTPPAVIRTFQQATEIKTGVKAEDKDKKKEEEETEAKPPLAAATQAPIGEAFVEVTEKATQATQQVLTTTVGAEKVEEPTRPTRRYGYFSLMLRSLPPFFPAGGYIRPNETVNVDTAGEIPVYRSGVLVGSMRFDGRGSETIKVTYLDVDGKVVDTGLPIELLKTELGYNRYLQWGIWRGETTQVMTDTDTGHSWDFYRMGFYVWGEHTTEAQMTALVNKSLDVTYSGPAYGKHNLQPAGERMNGTFSTQVHFGSRTLSNFNLSVSGGGHSATISGGHGGFLGTSSSFTIPYTSGTWKVDGMTAAAPGSARGAVFGPNGEHIGGTWIMQESVGSSNLAWGSFAGGR